MIGCGVCEMAIGAVGLGLCAALPESAESIVLVIGTIMGTMVGQGLAFVAVGIWDRLHD